ncbi:MAG TPA: hypothetical protein DEP91_12900 [Sphingomonas bacterium]|jgi:hypothetical protein|uniref:SRPBCC family protein n=1 Tax=Sphingomonas bacterium TaxID=1895847 RepID=A0A3D0WE62_9SPHN|nr:hypothetical protein [Sphingomonas bacterium]
MAMSERTEAAFVRTLAAIAAALAFAGVVYALLEAAQPDAGLVSFTFLLVLPAALCAFVAYVADPWKTRSRRAYLLVPVQVLAAVIAVSIFILREGTICIVLLSPLWLLSGMAGTALTYKLRRRVEDGRTYCTTLLLVPLLAMQVEPLVTWPTDSAVVTRSVVVAASPDRLWPLLRGIPDVRPGEGRWNLSQDVLGIPRPVGAQMVGEGVGATRLANWGPQIRFREKITDWRPGRAIAWTFHFDDVRGWAFTDRHLMPDSHYLKVRDGGYRLDPLPGSRTRVTLHTRYEATTPVNLYTRLWGELFLGDVQDNLLALVRHRAER